MKRATFFDDVAGDRSTYSAEDFNRHTAGLVANGKCSWEGVSWVDSFIIQDVGLSKIKVSKGGGAYVNGHMLTENEDTEISTVIPQTATPVEYLVCWYCDNSLAVRDIVLRVATSEEVQTDPWNYLEIGRYTANNSGIISFSTTNIRAEAPQNNQSVILEREVGRTYDAGECMRISNSAGTSSQVYISKDQHIEPPVFDKEQWLPAGAPPTPQNIGNYIKDRTFEWVFSAGVEASKYDYQFLTSATGGKAPTAEEQAKYHINASGVPLLQTGETTWGGTGSADFRKCVIPYSDLIAEMERQGIDTDLYEPKMIVQAFMRGSNNSAYGMFSYITKNRDEIILEGWFGNGVHNVYTLFVFFDTKDKEYITTPLIPANTGGTVYSFDESSLNDDANHKDWFAVQKRENEKILGIFVWWAGARYLSNFYYGFPSISTSKINGGGLIIPGVFNETTTDTTILAPVCRVIREQTNSQILAVFLTNYDIVVPMRWSNTTIRTDFAGATNQLCNMGGITNDEPITGIWNTAVNGWGNTSYAHWCNSNAYGQSMLALKVRQK